MTPFVAFLVGTFGSGIVLALVFGSLHLEAEGKAYRKGYYDGVCRAHNIVKEILKEKGGAE